MFRPHFFQLKYIIKKCGRSIFKSSHTVEFGQKLPWFPFFAKISIPEQNFNFLTKPPFDQSNFVITFIIFRKKIIKFIKK